MPPTLVLIFAIGSSTCWAMIEDNGSCNYTWYSMRDGQCKCGPELRGRLRCNDYNKTVEITAGYCMTYDPMGHFNGSLLVVTTCPYGALSTKTDRKYNRLPADPTLVNTTQCSPYHRKGLFCGECIEGFGPAVYSFDLHCANCSHFSTATAITLYITLECVPITVFYLAVLVVRPTLFNGPRLGYIVFCQISFNVLQYSRYIYSSIFDNVPRFFAVLGKTGLELSGLWNLKFLCFTIPPFCVSEKLNSVHVQTLGFVTPFLLLCYVLVTYIAAENHCLPRITVISRSIIHAFATMTMLSILSIICQVYTLSDMSFVTNEHGKIVGKVFERDPSFHNPNGHTPYLIISLVFGFVFAVIPGVLLCIYPTQVYRKLSQCLHPRRQLAIKIFVETVNSGFKDGLNGTRDYRMIPGAIILSALLPSLFTSFITNSGFNGLFTIALGSIFFLLAFLVPIIKPCKDRITNMSLSLHCSIVGFLAILLAFWWQDMLLESEVLAIMIILISLLPHLLMFIWIINCIIKKCNLVLYSGIILRHFRSYVGSVYNQARRKIVVRLASADVLESQPLINCH